MKTEATQSTKDLPIILDSMPLTNTLNSKYGVVTIIHSDQAIFRQKQDTVMMSSRNMVKKNKQLTLECNGPMAIPHSPSEHSLEGDAINESLSVNSAVPLCSTDCHEESICMRKLSATSAVMQNGPSPCHSSLSQ